MESMFPKVDDLKADVMASRLKHSYDVESLYHNSGICQSVARSEVFKDLILGVIMLNTVWIAIDTDCDHAQDLSQAKRLFQIVDCSFCAAFLFEISMRFGAFRRKLDAFSDSWFLFDSFLVALMFWESFVTLAMYDIFGMDPKGVPAKDSQILRVLRLVRLTRVARAAKILKYNPELLILARGMVGGMRSSLTVGILMTLIVFVFAIVFATTLHTTMIGSSGMVFHTVPSSMNFLMIQVLCGPDAGFMGELLTVGWPYYVLFLAFLFGANLTLMNMLIGILCDVVSSVSADAKEEAFIKEVDSQIARLAAALDVNNSGGISSDEFDIIIHDPLMTASFDELGVDIVSVAHFARFIYQQCEEIAYSDFGILVGQFRGTKNATVKDIMDMRRYLTMELLSFDARVEALLMGSKPIVSMRSRIDQLEHKMTFTDVVP
jgi:hypothetical protein